MGFFSEIRIGIYSVCMIYLLLSSLFATVNLDTDEFTFIREPYELFGGDYTTGYLKEKEYKNAFKTILKSYLFYWRYRPLNAPIIREEHKRLFSAEEARFGYVKPERAEKSDPRLDPNAINLYQKRLVVPEPDRFYAHGAGKPLLPALISVPQMAFVGLVASGGTELLKIQFNHNYHPLFILTRLIQIIAGLTSILILYAIIKTQFDAAIAVLGAAVFAFFPLTIKYFPNIHHDSILVPFLLGAIYFLLQGRYIKAGLLYGLALASKNTAIILVPAFTLYCIFEGYSLFQHSSITTATVCLKQRGKELAIFCVLALAILVIFSHPVSYFNEILTPITHREFDPRGEDVNTFTLTSQLHQIEDENRSRYRPEIQFIRIAFGYDSVFFLFIILMFFLCLQTFKKPVSVLSFIMILSALPYGLVFGHTLSYRSLIFLPFFSLLCVDVLTPKNIRILVCILLLFSLLYCLDPMTTDTIHLPNNTDSLFDSIHRWIQISAEL